ncbi:hypothetical protein ACHAWF_003715 [Thalassiosira exigua]
MLHDPLAQCFFNPSFVKDEFCGLTRNAVVVMIGDSLTWEQYDSLVQLTEGTPLRKRINRRVVSRRGTPVVINVCGGDTTLVYRWIKHLDGGGASIPVETMMEQMFPTMVLMNTGAHYQADGEFVRKIREALEVIERWQSKCQVRNLTCPFFWRTTSPGIPDCMNYTEPINDLAEMEDAVKSKPLYNWENFRHQNDLALEILESSPLDFDVLDGYEMGITRPDTRVSETDCLHSRDPAAGHAENTAMLHYLRNKMKREDLLKVAAMEHLFNRTTNVNEERSDLYWDLVNSPDYPYR